MNLWFLLTVSLLPYRVSVLATYPDSSGTAGPFVAWLGVTQLAFLVLCLVSATSSPARTWSTSSSCRR